MHLIYATRTRSRRFAFALAALALAASACAGEPARDASSGRAAGGDIAVSGLVLIPEGEPPAGSWPVVAWAHGTTGVADVCAPSRWADLYEYGGYLAALTRHGFVVVATDYEGLGTPGPHRYTDLVSEARGMVDSVVAVHHLVPDTTDIWVSMGHSQGGQAALGAAQYAGALKGFPLIATVAIAPASSLRLFPGLAGTEVRGYLAFVAAGVVASDPTVTLDDLLGPDALAHRSVLDTGCWSEVMDAFASVAPDQMLPPGPKGVAALQAFLDRNEPGTTKIDVSVLLVQGEADDSVPLAVTAMLRDHLCAVRDVVSLRTYPGLGHDEVLSPSLDDTAHWIAERFAGTPAIDECATTRPAVGPIPAAPGTAAPGSRAG